MHNIFEYDSDGNMLRVPHIRTFDDSKSSILKDMVAVSGTLKKRSELSAEEKEALRAYEEEKARRKRIGMSESDISESMRRFLVEYFTLKGIKTGVVIAALTAGDARKIIEKFPDFKMLVNYPKEIK